MLLNLESFYICTLTLKITNSKSHCYKNWKVIYLKVQPKLDEATDDKKLTFNSLCSILQLNIRNWEDIVSQINRKWDISIELFNILDDFLNEAEMEWKNYVGICRDIVPAHNKGNKTSAVSF